MVAMLGDGSADHFPEPGPGPRLATWAPVAGGEGPGNVESSGGVTVAFAGYLHGLPAGLQSEAEYVLARYHAGDWSWLASAAGVFSFAVVDRRRHRCVLGVDRLGVRPLLWMQDAAGVAFASDLAAFVPRLGPDREVDHDVLQEMLAVGFPLSDRTLLAGVERVPPGTLIEFEHGKTRATRYWSVADLPPIRSQDPDAFLDESQERLRYALRGLLSRSSGRALCPLSSGYDSRRLLLEGHAGGAALSAVTGVEFEPRGGRLVSLEPAVAGELCRRLGFPNRQVLTPGYSPMSPATARFVRNSFLDFQVIDHAHCWAMPLVGAVAQWRGQAALDGLHGDTFFNNPYYHLPRSVWGRWSAGTDVLDGIVANRDRWDRAWNGLVSRSLTARLTDAIRALPEGPYRLSYLFMLGRSSRITSLLPYGLLDLHVHPLCPYLDPIVMEHAMTFDPVLKGDLRLQARALGRHFPAFSDIPVSRTPLAEISEGYLHDWAGTDPAEEPLGAMDLARLALHPLRAGLPRPALRDLTFAALSAGRLEGLGGRWRKPGLRKLLQAVEALGWLRHADPAAWIARRRLAWSELRRSTHDPAREVRQARPVPSRPTPSFP